MFNWLKQLFSRPVPAAEQKPELPGEKKPEVPGEKKPGMLEKACQNCGKPIQYDPKWTHIPNYCRECRAKFDEE